MTSYHYLLARWYASSERLLVKGIITVIADKIQLGARPNPIKPVEKAEYTTALCNQHFFLIFPSIFVYSAYAKHRK